MIERVRQREHAMPADPAPCRLDSGQPAGRRRKPDRTAGVAADRSVAEPGRGRDAGSARRGADPVIRVPGIERGLIVRMMAGVGAFRHLELSERDRAGALEPINDRRIERRHELRMDRRAARGRRKCRVAQVLQPDRNAMKRAAPDALGDLAVVLLCLRHGPLRQDNGISVQTSIELSIRFRHRLE